MEAVLRGIKPGMCRIVEIDTSLMGLDEVIDDLPRERAVAVAMKYNHRALLPGERRTWYWVYDHKGTRIWSQDSLVA